VAEADVIMVIGANPTDGHPVFASRMKRRIREGAELIVVDPRRIDLVRSPHIEAAHHLQLKPSTNVAVVNAMAHVVVTEGLADLAFVAQRCEGFAEWAEFVARPENSPEATEGISGVPAEELRAAARLYAAAPNGAIYYGLGVTEHSQGSTMVMGMANLAMACGNIGRDGVGVNPLRGRNNVQGSCDMGRSRMSCPATGTSPMTPFARCSRTSGVAPSCPSPDFGSRTCSTRRSMAPSAVCSCTVRTSLSPTRTWGMSPPR
jgi:formate dehydrogenase major subunit